jgi:hypothetical protein
LERTQQIFDIWGAGVGEKLFKSTGWSRPFRPAVWLLKKLALAAEVQDLAGRKDELSCKDIFPALCDK